MHQSPTDASGRPLYGTELSDLEDGDKPECPDDCARGGVARVETPQAPVAAVGDFSTPNKQLVNYSSILSSCV